MKSFKKLFSFKNKTTGPTGATGPQGPQGPQGLKGEDCDDSTDFNLPPSPFYPFPECATCEIIEGEVVCSNVENKDKFYVLGVRNDNTTYWKKIDLQSINQ